MGNQSLRPTFPPSRSARRAFWGLLVFLLGVGGCSSSDDTRNEEASAQRRLRLLGARPAARLAPEELFARTIVQEYSVGALGIEDRPMQEAPTNAPSPTVLLHRALGRRAATIDEVEVSLGSEFSGGLELGWVVEGQPPTPGSRLRAEVSDFDTSVTFRVAAQEDWTGSIGEVWITTGTSPPPVVERVRFLTWDLESGGSPADRLWQVSIGETSRRALVLAPGQKVQFEVEVEVGSRLELAHAASLGNPGLSVGIGSSELRSVRPGRRWRELEVDLSAHAGKQQLWFSTHETRGLTVVGNPRLTGRRGAGGPEDGRPNVLWIVIDTLRADRFSPAVMPRLWEWFRTRGTRFESAYAAAPWTLPSFVTMLTGMDALTHGSNYGAVLDPRLDTTPRTFREHGYATLAATGGGYVSPAFGLDLGFDRFWSWSGRLGDASELDRGIEVLTDWLLENADDPFFALFHTYEVHAPFHRREPWFSQRIETVGGAPGAEAPIVYLDQTERRRQLQDIKRYGVATRGGYRLPDRWELLTLEALYDSGASYVDARIAQWLERLEAVGALEDTVVVLSSDHGEALGERGLAVHSHLYDFNLAVPLAISWPQLVEAPVSVDQAISLADLPATLVEIALGRDWRQGRGRSLVPMLRGEARTPDDLWSYAGSTNLGVGLLHRNRLALILSDSAVGAARGSLEGFDLGPRSRESKVLSSDQIPAELLARVQAKLGSSAGRHLRLDNRSELDLQLSLEPASIQYVKVVDLPAGVVTRHTEDSLRLDIPPATALWLRLDGPLALRSPGLTLSTSEYHCRVEPSGAPTDQWFFDPGTGHCSTPSAMGPVELTLALKGPGSSFRIPELDREQRARLRGLGYLR